MSTLSITQTGDLALVFNARGKMNLRVERDEVIAGAIKIRNRFVLYLGEWFKDTRIGVPYFQLVFRKNPDLAVVRRLFQRVIASVPIVSSVGPIVLTFDPTTRNLSMEFSATADPNRTITGGTGVPFIVDGKAIASESATNNQGAQQ